jgi:hypothetical protein
MNTLDDTPTDDQRQAVRDVLVRAGLSLPVEAPAPYAQRLTDDERAALADRLAQGGPASALIIAERDGR